MNTRAQAESLAGRSYVTSVRKDQTTDGNAVWMASCPELEGCFGQGDTEARAREDLHLAMIDYIESLLEDGLPVPPPAQVIDPTAGTAAYRVLTLVWARELGTHFERPKQESYEDAGLFSAST